MLQKKLMENKKIEIIWDSVMWKKLLEIKSLKMLKALKIKNLKTNKIDEIKIRWLIHCYWS